MLLNAAENEVKAFVRRVLQPAQHVPVIQDGQHDHRVSRLEATKKPAPRRASRPLPQPSAQDRHRRPGPDGGIGRMVLSMWAHSKSTSSEAAIVVIQAPRYRQTCVKASLRVSRMEASLGARTWS